MILLTLRRVVTVHWCEAEREPPARIFCACIPRRSAALAGAFGHRTGRGSVFDNPAVSWDAESANWIEPSRVGGSISMTPCGAFYLWATRVRSVCPHLA
jgi:hypothetical protein